MSKKLSNQDLESELLKLKEENENLRKSEIQNHLLLKASLESAPNMIALSIDTNHRYLYFNDTHQKVMYDVYKAKIGIGMNILNCISNDKDRVKAKANYDKALNGKTHSEIEIYGEEVKFYFESFFRPIFNKANDVIGATAFAINITEKIKAEQALIESETKHQAMMSNIGDVIGIADANGTLKYKSSNVERLFGWTVEEMLGNDAFVNVHPTDLVALQERVFALFEQDNAAGVFEYRYMHKDGKYRWVELKAVNNIKNPAINGILFNYHDISDRKEAERILKEKEMQYKSLFENLSNSSSLYEVVLNEKGEPCDYRFLAVNPIFESSVGRKGVDLIGTTLLEQFPETEKEWLDLFKGVCITGKSGILESYTKALDMYFEIIAYVPQPGQMAMIGSDITERKKSELSILEHQKVLKSQNEEYLTLNEELNERNVEYATLNNEYKAQNEQLILAIEKAQESDRLKDEFLNNMSHEVRTPMNGIIGFSQLLDIPDLDEESRTSYIDVIQQSSKQLLDIIDNIIEISKLGTKQVKVVPKRINVNGLLSELYAIFNIHAENKNIALQLKNEWADSESDIILDEIKLYKILSNLLENAMKFTEKGFVEFGYKLVNQSIDSGEDSEFIQFYVKDTGIGIEEEKREQIFVKFSQINPNLMPQFGGLGLGLAIAKENTELLGGKIALESKKGEGSIFTVTVPFGKV